MEGLLFRPCVSLRKLGNWWRNEETAKRILCLTYDGYWHLCSHICIFYRKKLWSGLPLRYPIFTDILFILILNNMGATRQETKEKTCLVHIVNTICRVWSELLSYFWNSRSDRSGQCARTFTVKRWGSKSMNFEDLWARHLEAVDLIFVRRACSHYLF